MQLIPLRNAEFIGSPTAWRFNLSNTSDRPVKYNRSTLSTNHWFPYADTVGVATFSVHKHVCDVGCSTSHKPTRIGMEPVILEIVDFIVLARHGLTAFSVHRHVCAVGCSTSHKPTRIGMEPVGRETIDLVVAAPLPNKKFADPEIKFLKNR